MLRLRDLREDADLTQTEMGNIIGVDQSYYAKYESEKINLPIHHLKKFAKHFNVSTDFIIGLIDEPIKLYPHR